MGSLEYQRFAKGRTSQNCALCDGLGRCVFMLLKPGRHQQTIFVYRVDEIGRWHQLNHISFMRHRASTFLSSFYDMATIGTPHALNC
jgi:hypothetical protein